MIELLNDFGSRWLDYFGLALLQNSLFVGAILVVLHWLKDAPAKVRYAVGLVGLFKLLLPPFLPLPAGSTALVTTPVMSELGAIFTPSRITAGSEAAASPAPAMLEPAGLLFGVWVLVSFVLLLAAMIATFRLSLRLEGATPVAPASVPAGFEGRGIAIVKSPRIALPLTIGILPRRVYVPEAWDNWSWSRREMVLRHELAHIERRDGLIQLLQIVARALYFFHPLVLLLDRRLRDDREMACDDASVGFDRIGAAVYARHLVEIAEAVVHNPVRCDSASTILRHKSELLRRVRYQMKENRMNAMSRTKAAAVVLAMMLLIVPLSWYHGADNSSLAMAAGRSADTGADLAGGQAGSARDTGAKHGKQMVNILIEADGNAAIDGNSVGVAKLVDALTPYAQGNPKDYVFNIVCREGVTMATFYEVEKVLIENKLMQVNFVDGIGKELALMLPPFDVQDRLADMPEHDLTTLNVDARGNMSLDGEAFTATGLRTVLVERLAANPKLIVIIQTAAATPYHDFTAALDLVKQADAPRVVISPPAS